MFITIEQYLDTPLEGLSSPKKVFRIPFEGDVPNIPEFGDSIPDKVLVDIRRVGVGGPKSTLASAEFRACSGFVFGNANGKTFGMLHAYPRFDLRYDVHDEDTSKFKQLRGCQAIYVRSLVSFHQDAMIRRFAQRFGIIHTRTILFDANKTDNRYCSDPFDLIYRAHSNEIVIVRHGYKDTLVFNGFEGN